jgi:hypothetical protein
MRIGFLLYSWFRFEEKEYRYGNAHIISVPSCYASKVLKHKWQNGEKEKRERRWSGEYQSRRKVPFFSSSRYCPMARMSCPARRRYPARTSLSAWGSSSASLSTCRVNSVLADNVSRSGDVPGERPKKDGRLRVLLRLRMGGDGEADSSLGDEGASISVRERCMRLGRARGPPGTDGALVICTGRGFGAGGCFVSRVWEADGLMLFV